MSKNVAFIGLAGPFGYDYRYPAPRVNELDASSPNPVLENVLGLLICYDELLFLSPQFCPADMRDLPYVKFLSDDSGALQAASAALAGYDQVDHPDWSNYPSFDRFAEISAEMRGSNEEFAIDNHTHTVHLGTTLVSGSAMALDNAMRDLWIAAELGLSHADVIFSSPAQEALNLELEREVADGRYFAASKRAAATDLVALQVPNFLGQTGSYHESLESIRDRPDAIEFRKYLIELDPPTADGIALANEISRAAFDASEALSRRYLKKEHWFRSLGIPAVRGALNLATGPLGLGGAPVGTLAAAALDVPFKLGERQLKNASRWAPFVVALHRPRV